MGVVDARQLQQPYSPRLLTAYFRRAAALTVRARFLSQANGDPELRAA